MMTRTSSPLDADDKPSRDLRALTGREIDFVAGGMFPRGGPGDDTGPKTGRGDGLGWIRSIADTIKGMWPF